MRVGCPFRTSCVTCRPIDDHDDDGNPANWDQVLLLDILRVDRTDINDYPRFMCRYAASFDEHYPESGPYSDKVIPPNREGPKYKKELAEANQFPELYNSTGFLTHTRAGDAATRADHNTGKRPITADYTPITEEMISGDAVKLKGGLDVFLPEYLVHRTSTKFLPIIMHTGLISDGMKPLPMSVALRGRYSFTGLFRIIRSTPLRALEEHPVTLPIRPSDPTVLI